MGVKVANSYVQHLYLSALISGKARVENRCSISVELTRVRETLRVWSRDPIEALHLAKMIT